MATNMDFADEAIEWLSRVASGVRGRKMFGGVGIYSGETFFALVAYDRLWFKVDDSNRIDFEVRGMKPFQPFLDRPMTMSYYELPPELLDDPEALRVWTARSIAIARSAKKAKRPKVSTRRKRVAKQ
ncbi:MAG: TfoX/Sxy family protein [Planctomycetia bacterium]|nr:TfoX/Sxy family protein [Planctomycetia bacterium]